MKLKEIRRRTAGLPPAEKASWYRTYAPMTVIELEDGSRKIFSHSGEVYVVSPSGVCECKAAQVGNPCYHVPYVLAEAGELSPMDALPF